MAILRFIEYTSQDEVRNWEALLGKPHLYRCWEYVDLWLFGEEINEQNTCRYFPEAHLCSLQGMPTEVVGSLIIALQGLVRTDGEVHEHTSVAWIGSPKTDEDFRDGRWPEGWPEDVPARWSGERHYLSFPDGEYPVGTALSFLRVGMGSLNCESSHICQVIREL